MGLLPAVDLIGLALFQAMQVSLGTSSGAATQIVMMMTSIAYMPAIGIASAGTTLVGQSDRRPRQELGGPGRQRRHQADSCLHGAGECSAGSRGTVVAAAVHLPFGSARAPRRSRSATSCSGSPRPTRSSTASNLGAAFCLRGAGDARVPTLMVLVLSWVCFVPLAHMLSFAPGRGWVDFLPQFGLGAAGGWGALLLYTFALATAMFLRWRVRCLAPDQSRLRARAGFPPALLLRFVYRSPSVCARTSCAARG